MANKGIKSISRFKFLKINDERKRRIEQASNRPIENFFPVNELSKSLHPDRQYVTVSKIKEWDANCKSISFVPDPEKGTTELAYFKAGSYLSITLEIDGRKISRPYSISSSPRQALEGVYVLTVKRVPGGLVSNYILDNLKEGDSVEVSAPLGEFVYIPVRDGKTVIGVAGGSGITPFYSFARAIADNDENFNLILLYGSRTEKDILFKQEFDELQKNCDKIKVVHVLSDEEKEGYEHGFITADLIKKYAPDENYSIFLCGPEGMYRFLDKEIEKLNIERKWVRHELQGEIHNPEKQSDYPKGLEVPETVKLTVTVCDNTRIFEVSTKDTILQSLEKNGVEAPSHCRCGECGWCHSLLLKGNVYCPERLEHRREADLDYNYIHPCCSFPLSDICIEVPPNK
ncbi:MAG: FAD-binding oxidoreductase [Erysipelotrichaceae bacterium]